MKNVKYSPMIEQYLEIKNNYKDYIIFFRLGDFYEMFFEDAHIAAKELELALTGKDAGVSERVPMCGIPYHAAKEYIEKMVLKGYKIAIVEQIEDPKEAVGIVKRGVVQIITPGTLSSGLDEKENNYIATIDYQDKDYILAYADISTGDGYVSLFKKKDILLNELLSLKIKEVITTPDFTNYDIQSFIRNEGITHSVEALDGIPKSLERCLFNLDKRFSHVIGLLINYYIDTQKVMPIHFKPFLYYEKEDYMRLDAFSKENLELTETLRFNSRNGSLLNLIDKCNTAMGSRMLKNWLIKPLLSEEKINLRLDFVEAFYNNYIIREEIKSSLKNVYDLERILGRISSNSANAKDMVWLRRSLKEAPLIKEKINELEIDDAKKAMLKIDIHEDLYNLLEASLNDDPPFTLREGGIIKEGYNQELDELREIASNGKAWLIEYEKRLKEETGLKNLKVGYNRVTGYYIEITKGALKDLKEELKLERRATLVNSERFITDELKQYENKILNAKDQIIELEYELFTEIRRQASLRIETLQNLANQISEIDSYISLAEVALKYNYVRPTFNSNRTVSIIDGRHPVLESILKSDYIFNDVIINKYNMILITGPNMSGKSTYMRMLASIAILAQMGSFVPAKSANLMIFDGIYTRIGAKDDLVSGKSTFMVEMSEANYAIKNATKNSLILFDEIGRGTATYDGMALAEAILEYIHEAKGAITLFSTHYHELTQLEGKLSRLKNVHVGAKEEDGKIVFLHKVIDGPTDKSYGINVASLAGLPKSLIKRSKEILDSLEANKASKEINLNLFNFNEYDELPEVKEEVKEDEIKKRLSEIDINKISPLEALNLLSELKDIENGKD